MLELGRRAKAAARAAGASAADAEERRSARHGGRAVAHRDDILAANAADVEAAAANGLSAAMIDRLRLDEKRLAAMADGIRAVAALEDPVGETMRQWTRPNGIEISKVRVPIGVVGIIYESRPNVTSDAAVLCTKTGNAAILRGGSESLRSNLAIAAALRAGAAAAGLPADCILLIPRTDREAVRLLAETDQYVDMIVPARRHGADRDGGEPARMPVIKHYHGVCILYVDRAADLDMAVNSGGEHEGQRPGVCNAVETLLVHRDVAERFLPRAAEALRAHGVELRGDAETLRILGDGVGARDRGGLDTEFLDLILAVKVVGRLG